MKKLLIFSIMFNIFLFGFALVNLSKEKIIVVTDRAPTYEARNELLLSFKGYNKSIIFIGDSHVQFNEWAELFNNPNVLNRGIGGETTEQLSKRILRVVAQKPKKLFIIIGTNDIFGKVDQYKTINNFNDILSTIKAESPETKVYVCAVFPSSWKSIPKDKITALNINIKNVVEKKGDIFIDTYSPLAKDNSINPLLTWDGVHLNSVGYNVIKAELLPYIE